MKIIELSNVIKEIRSLGWSQKQISDKTGIPQATVSRIETGIHKDPRYSTATKLIALLDEAKQAA